MTKHLKVLLSGKPYTHIDYKAYHYYRNIKKIQRDGCNSIDIHLNEKKKSTCKYNDKKEKRKT